MELIHVVSDEDAKLAKKMEAKLLELPIESGILFAGVSVDPNPVVFRVWIGCSRGVDPRAIRLLVSLRLREEVKEGRNIVVESVAMGSIRNSAVDK